MQTMIFSSIPQAVKWLEQKTGVACTRGAIAIYEDMARRKAAQGKAGVDMIPTLFAEMAYRDYEYAAFNRIAKLLNQWEEDDKGCASCADISPV